jgi:hypothetical protein
VLLALGGALLALAAYRALDTTSAAPEATGSWRAFLFAGNAIDPVFDNATGTFATLLTPSGPVQRFTSSADETNGSPLSVPAIRGAAQKTGGTRDSRCLLYITTHGNEGRLLFGGEQQTLRPDGLAALANLACGDSEAVIVISACHAESMVSDALLTERRIVLAAARHDRTSFGCSFRHTYNFFDGCLIENWSSASTWAALFERAQSCIVAAEQREGMSPPSEPKIWIGARVADLKLPGRD